MSESEPTETGGISGETARDGARWSMAELRSRVIHLPAPAPRPKSVPSVVSFDRHELREFVEKGRTIDGVPHDLFGILQQLANLGLIRLSNGRSGSGSGHE